MRANQGAAADWRMAAAACRLDGQKLGRWVGRELWLACNRQGTTLAPFPALPSTACLQVEVVPAAGARHRAEANGVSGRAEGSQWRSGRMQCLRWCPTCALEAGGPQIPTPATFPEQATHLQTVGAPGSSGV